MYNLGKTLTNTKNKFSVSKANNFYDYLYEIRKVKKAMKSAEKGEYMSIEEAKKRMNQKYDGLHL